MNMRVLLGRLAPFTVAVGRTVCLFMDFKWARKLRLGSQAQIETPYPYSIFDMRMSLCLKLVIRASDAGAHARPPARATERPSGEPPRRFDKSGPVD